MKKSKYTPDGKLRQTEAPVQPVSPKRPSQAPTANNCPPRKQAPFQSLDKPRVTPTPSAFAAKPASAQNRRPVKSTENTRPSKPKKKKNKIFNIILDILIVVTILGAIYMYVEPIIRSKNQDREEKRVMSDFDSFLNSAENNGLMVASVGKNSKPVPGEAYEYEGDSLTVPEPERDEDGNIILRYEGRIIMPDTKIMTLLAADDSLHALRYSAGHHNTTPGIDEKGRTVILGHNFHDRGRVFSRLDEVKVDHKIYVDFLKDRKRYIYKVYKTDKIPAADLLTRVEETSKENEIMLVTCGDEYIDGAAAYRLLVYAKLDSKIDIPADAKFTE